MVAARLIAIALAIGLWALPVSAGDRFILVASTTSTQNSGLFDHLLPQFEAKTGIEVRVVAVGTGQALKLGERGDADLLLVHDATAEYLFMVDGYGVDRQDVMYNDFVLVGPADDPAKVAGVERVDRVFRLISKTQAPFVSRGDDSGTHKAELRIWIDAGISVAGHSGDWYREAGAGMGATLNIASVMGAYTLADRATWLAFGNKGDLRIVNQGGEQLLNSYGVILVNPKRFPHVKEKDARAFMNWLTGKNGQAAIAAFRIQDQQVFFPSAQ